MALATPMFQHARGVFSRIIGFFVLLALCFSLPSLAFASTPSFSLSPLVLDGKGKPREILRYTVTLTNAKDHIVSVYPWVVNLDPANGEELQEPLGKADLSTSLANWIEVSRGVVDLGPHESREIPILVQINMSARPGVYHAYVHFSEGPTRIDAESDRERTRSVAINMEVLDDANERLSLGTFTPDKNIFGDGQASFSFRLENTGNRGVTPEGKIRIFDRKGEEVAAIDANADGRKLEPSAKEMLAGVWAADGHFGKYKAVLDLQYGKGTIQDTVFFWVLPWKSMIGALGAILVVVAAIALLAHSRAQSRPEYAYAYARSDEDEEEDIDDEEENETSDDEDEEPIERGPGIVARARSLSVRAYVFARGVLSRGTKKTESEDMRIPGVHVSHHPVVARPTPSGPSHLSGKRTAASTEGALRLSAPKRKVHEGHIVNLRGPSRSS